MPTEPDVKDPNDTSDKPPFRESAEVLLAMWKAGEYPNPSDAVQDCKALLYAVPPEHASYRPQLEAILEEATVQAAKLAAARAAMPDPPSVPRLPAPARKPAPPPVKKPLPPTPAKKSPPAPAAKKAPVKKAAAKKAAPKKAAAKKAPAKKAAAKKAPAKKPAKKAKAAPKKKPSAKKPSAKKAKPAKKAPKRSK
jgi:hypothetical protein